MSLELEPAYSSGEQTADAAIMDSYCLLSAVQVITNGTDDATVIIYDNASEASGKVVLEITVNDTDHYGGRVWINPVIMDNGIFVDISGTGASYIIEYLKP